MKPTFFLLALLFVFNLATGVSAAEDFAPRFEAIVAEYIAGNQFSGSVLVERDGEILLNGAYGWANREWKVPTTTGTRYRIGSLTKQFTAAAILLLEERGLLRTDDLLTKHLPDSPAAWGEITVFHLLTHTSGIPNFTSFPDFASTQANRAGLDDLIRRFQGKPLDFAPGTQWNYSNSGYVLLGAVIQKVSGQSYAQFLDEHFFEPLGMRSTGYDYNALILPLRASGYTYTNGYFSNAAFTDMSVPFSAGALYSTTGDLLVWQKALASGKVLSAPSLEKMTTSVTNRYAMGLFSARLNGRQAWFHGGAIAGFQSELDYYPDPRLTVIVLGNVSTTAVADIALHLGGLVLGRAVVLPSERREVSVPSRILADYVGVYRLDPHFTMTLSLQGGRLFATPTGQRRTELFAESETRFFFRDVDAQVVFHRDDRGQVSGFVYTQDGNDTLAPKE